MRLVSRYFLAEHIQPFFLGLGVILFVLITNFVADSLDLLLRKGVPHNVTLEVFLLSLGWMTALAAPMAVLVATLMAFGRLSGDKEVLALRAAGVAPSRIARPVFLAAFGLALVLVAYNEWVLPATNHRLANLLFEIHRRQPTLGLEEGVFLNTFPGHSILVEEVDDQLGTITGVSIYETLPEGGARTVRAARGVMSWSADGAVLTLDLEDGEIHESSPTDPAAYSRVVFADLTLHLRRPAPRFPGGQRRARGDREMGSLAMMHEVRGLEREREESETRGDRLVAEEAARLIEGTAAAEGPRSPLARQRQLLHTLRGEANTRAACQRRINRYRVEIQKKFAIPAACLVFVLVGTPLGIRAHRGGMGIAIGISVLFFLAHYLFLVGGEHLADRGVVPPAAAMWGGDVVVGAVGLWSFWRTEKDLPLLPRPSPRVTRALGTAFQWAPGGRRISGPQGPKGGGRG